MPNNQDAPVSEFGTSICHTLESDFDNSRGVYDPPFAIISVTYTVNGYSCSLRSAQ